VAKYSWVKIASWWWLAWHDREDRHALLKEFRTLPIKLARWGASKPEVKCGYFEN
jgi:hypothetical protein